MWVYPRKLNNEIITKNMTGFSERFCLPMMKNLRIHLNTSQNVPPILLLNSL